jgi:hypothetical protein
MRLLLTMLALSFASGCGPPGNNPKLNPDLDGDGLEGAEDCDDTDASVGGPSDYFFDEDLDGHGAADQTDSFCDQPAGYVLVGDDCDDQNNTVYPGAEDVCDGLDNDCDGDVDDGAVATTFYTDVDADGYGDDAATVQACIQPEGTATVGGDCDDADPAYNPGALEEDCEDPNDYNCDGSVGYADGDADGFAACQDCNDADPAVSPDGLEVCNEIDDDCDTLVDDADDSLDSSTGTIWYADVDFDGYGDPATAAWVCEPGPGWVADNTDCDDTRPDLNPGATEVCNGYDDDCDGLVDDGDDSVDVTTGSAFYTDADADGYGDDATAVWACEAPAGSATLAGDCDDADAAYNPGALEDDCADPNDYNCDGSVGYTDGDGDGYAACEECDDTNAANNPAATEVCDGADNDCDGTADEPDAADASTWYTDADSDGYGDAATATMACDAPAGTVADATDCDDTTAAVNPAVVETCNGVDDNCDGTVDEDTAADASTWYADTDADGYGDAATATMACDAPAGTVADATDCDDTDGDVNPGAFEACNGIDDNCDGAIDEDGATDVLTWYADTDGDGFGDAASSVVDCEQPADHVSDDSDCDDSAGAVNPDATELCDGIDNDCDSAIDEDSAADAATWYADTDGDGYGNAASATVSCSAPAGSVSDSSDCDDGDGAVNPAATEVCDGIDNDCNGVTDEDSAADASTWYTDSDGDGYGDAGSPLSACDAPAGAVADATDCDDTDGDVNPAATEVCDGADNDCDGSVDPTDAWWDTAWPYRMLLTVSASGYDVSSPPVLTDIDFRGALDTLGDSSAFDADTVRVVVQDCAAGSAELPSQYVEDYVGLLSKVDAADSTSEYGTLAFLADSDGDYSGLDLLSAGSTMTVGVYFGGTATDPGYSTDLVATSASLGNDVTTASFDSSRGGLLSSLSTDGSPSVEDQASSCCGNSIYGTTWSIDPQDAAGDLALLFEGPVVAAVEASGSRSDGSAGYDYSYIYLAFAGRPELYSKVYQVTNRSSVLSHASDYTYGIRPWETMRSNISSGATFTTDAGDAYADVSNGTWGSAFAFVEAPTYLVDISNYDPYIIVLANDYGPAGTGTPTTLPSGTAYLDHPVMVHLPHAGDFDSDVQSTLFGLVDGVSVTQGAPEAR